MGVNDLWGALAEGFSPRIPFSVFVSQFMAKYGRPPKIAIDGFMFIFQLKPLVVQLEDNIIVRNFISKLCYLLLLSVTYVVVLDGPDHPRKIRHNIVNDDTLKLLDILGMDPFYSGNIVQSVKKAMNNYSIQFIQSPGEAEAECAFMQRNGIVDYVISDDVDTLVFGATKLLRNFLKRVVDKPAGSIITDSSYNPSPSSPIGGFYVTPVDMEKVTANTGLDVNRLVLIATVRGGDYSTGVTNIGIARALRLALCGTQFASFHHRSPTKVELKKANIIRDDPPPDFSRLFISCFFDLELGSGNYLNPRRPEQEMKSKLNEFIVYLNKIINERFRDIFERMAKLDNLTIDELIAMAYLYPNVSRRRFEFKNDLYSNGESSKVPNGVYVTYKNVVLKLIKRKDTIEAEITTSKTIQNEEFFRVKYDINGFRKIIQYTNVKDSDLEGEDEESDQFNTKESKSDDENITDKEEGKKWQRAWFPKSLIEWADQRLVNEFYLKRKPSPKKQQQKTTLDKLFMNVKHRENVSSKNLNKLDAIDSGIKAKGVIESNINISSKETEVFQGTSKITELFLPIDDEEIVINEEFKTKISSSHNLGQKATSKLSPSKSKRATKKKSPSKKTKKLLPGQSLVTSFFTTAGDSPTHDHTYDYNEMAPDPFNDSSNTLSRGSTALSLGKVPPLYFDTPIKRPISTGLAETSPTKRNHLLLSPDSSPHKSRDMSDEALKLSERLLESPTRKRK